MNQIRPEVFERAAEKIRANLERYSCIALMRSHVTTKEIKVWEDCHRDPKSKLAGWFDHVERRKRQPFIEQLLREMAFNLRNHGYEE